MNWFPFFLVFERNHPRYAVAIMIPVIFCLVFTVNQWWKTETGTRERLTTLIFLILMFYPPFVALRLIYYLIKNDRKWLEAKRNYDINMSSIGKLKIWTNFYESLYKPILHLNMICVKHYSDDLKNNLRCPFWDCWGMRVEAKGAWLFKRWEFLSDFFQAYQFFTQIKFKWGNKKTIYV